MQPILIFADVTDVSLSLLRKLVRNNIATVVVTDSYDLWKQSAPDVFTATNSFVTTTDIGYKPEQAVLLESSPHKESDFTTTISRFPNIRVVKVFSPAMNAPSEATRVNHEGSEERAEEIIKALFSFGGNEALVMHLTPLAGLQTTTSEKAVPSSTDTPESVTTVKKRTRRKLWLLVAIVVALLLLPFTILGLATALSLFGVNLMVQGDLSLARTAFASSQSLASMTASVPIQRIASSGVHGTEAAENTSKILSGVFGNENYPLEDLSNNLQYNLQAIHRELSFLDAEVGEYDNIVMRFLPTDQLQKIRTAAEAGADIAGRLPSLLGIGEQKTYMVLLQNNMELRPTGGFIGSFALVHFAEGRLVDAPVYDVYSADGQLKGYVEPPAAIRDYLGEASWYLRDSNWDPDFPTSAQRAEWFLDKSLGIPVDGVVAIDLEFMRSLIAAQESLKITDFDMTLTADNFYEKIQSEVHTDFFPGSRKKAAVLTAALNTLLNNLMQDVSNKELSLAPIALTSLSQKHIQIHLNDQNVQDWVQVLGWSGEANPTVCSGNCQNIWFGLAEANVGVNKANYFIERSAKLSSQLIQGQWEHRMTLELSNTASGDGVEGEHDYTTYIRLLTPDRTNVDGVTITTAGVRKTVAPEIEIVGERKESGVLVKVPAASSTVITYSWVEESNIDFQKEGSVQLHWRKQAGTVGFPIHISIEFPPSLTELGTVEYNSNLQEDFTAEIPW